MSQEEKIISIVDDLYHTLDAIQTFLPDVPLRVLLSKEIYRKVMQEGYDPEDHKVILCGFPNVQVELRGTMKSFHIKPQNPDHYDIFSEATKGKDFCAG